MGDDTSSRYRAFEDRVRRLSDGKTLREIREEAKKAKRVEEAKQMVRKLWREFGPDWAGIAPSHLSTYLHCYGGEAEELLLALWQAGVVKDTGYGAPLVYPDGHVGTNRFAPARAKVREAD